MKMSSNDMTALLMTIIGTSIDEGPVDINGEGDHCEITDATEFKDAGVLTQDDGIVIKMADGTEFQITVVRSK